MPIDVLLSNKNIIVVHPFSHDEIMYPKIGATRLIYEQIGSLKDIGHKVNVLSLADIGSAMSFFIRLEGRIRRKGRMRKARSSSENRRWQLNLFALIIAEVLSRIDIWYILRLRKKLKSLDYPSSIIFNYPCGFVAFTKAARNFNVAVAIYEHNVEWKFYESNVINNKFTSIAIHILKKIELRALVEADHIICTSKNDFNTLRDQIDHRKINVWVPVIRKNHDGYSKGIDHGLKQRLDNNFVIGFVGTNFGPNISAVTTIFDLAKRMQDMKVVFLIMGNVSEAFDNDNNIPNNIFFTGYVENLDSYLYACDTFLNLKTTSHTGVEIKMFDYLKFAKPIITTQIGASGFENNSNVLVVQGIEDAVQLLLDMVRKKEGNSDKSRPTSLTLH